MCEYSNKLISLLDHELPAEEAVKVELHLESCNECRGQISVFAKVSREVDAYCNEAITVNARRVAPAWASSAIAAGVVTAVIVLFLAWPRARVKPSTMQLPPVATANSLGVAGSSVSGSVPSIHRNNMRHAGAVESRIVPVQNNNSSSAQRIVTYDSQEEPMIQIAIPADEIFPPGAIPEGVNFLADLTIAADGTAEGMRLRPMLAGFERRTTRP
ncbi:MAG TPA: zf-HC2 domain-containing protein [Candidatus Saccharimonadales bacterium]|jgi:hypothetical protein|nr:zf-HC2 domain-containing protein [Candidatus Saccharimonadales bacterium]